MTLRETIIHESLKLFSLKGYVGTSIHDILTAANTSKGGFYNHFTSKEDLFHAVLDMARKIWREKNLNGLDTISSPKMKMIKILENFRDRYLKDAENFPGGCIFITFSVEFDNQYPLLSKKVTKGFVGLKAMIKSLLDEAVKAGELNADTETGPATELLFAGILGTTVTYGMDKSSENLNISVQALIDYLNDL